ncbi:Hypothetical protein P9215_14371 [Prochlorococcus marinus str. MIT 9215]|uniref:Uncharacterized protein n=1 Tax=Prochlorococcus marinus (strain MIT 9215) TaxID=93060 RepID=A8G619_PROM2|nr:hypothetical protein [Prochlorococcus marinus]ABV51050.1 Hypothetical protein P9215_14371 [Prochlorococcus marinus str. MIT 9215]
MKKILILVPGEPKRNMHSGWSGMVKDFVKTISKSDITVYSISSNPFNKKNINLKNFFKSQTNTIVERSSKFESLKRLIFAFFTNLPFQSVIFSPNYSWDLQYQKLYEESDIVIFITSRVSAYFKDNKKSSLFKHKKHLIFLVDPLHICYEYHAKQTNNIFLKLLFWRESKKLKLIENFNKEFDLITLVNKYDSNFLKTNSSTKIIEHPLMPYYSFKEKAIEKNDEILNFDKKRKIYLFGNFNYQPNIIGLVEFINFLSKSRINLEIFFKKNSLKIEVVGIISKKNKLLLNKILDNYKLNKFIFIKGPIKNFKDLKKDGLATISFVRTFYGRQTKEFDSLNLLLPILKFKNKKEGCKSFYELKPYFLKFSTVDGLIDHIKSLINKTNFIDLNKSIKKDLFTEVNRFNLFCEEILNLDK